LRGDNIVFILPSPVLDCHDIAESDVKHQKSINQSINQSYPFLKLLGRKQEFNYFLAHLAKGNVSFCHHLASVVCRPLTFHILIFSSETR
jgi:hypothetical protein